MSILDDFAKYTDANGLVQNIPSPGVDASGNGLLYTAEAIVALDDNAALFDTQRAAFRAAYDRCLVDGGLLFRNADKSGGQEGPDDYFGAGLAFAFIDYGDMAVEMLKYGDRRCTEWDASDTKKYSKLVYTVLRLRYPGGIPNVYNNLNPGKFSLSSWMGRFPHLQAHLSYAATHMPTVMQRVWWAVAVSASAFAAKDNHDSWILSWTLVRTWEHRHGQGLLAKLAVKFWRKKFAQAWNNPGDLLAAYFGNPQHPSAVWLKQSH